MSDDLRTRIAAVLNDQLKNQALERNGWHESWDDSSLVDVEIDDLDLNALADVLIRELGLERENNLPLGDERFHIPMHRYVTEWTADE